MVDRLDPTEWKRLLPEEGPCSELGLLGRGEILNASVGASYIELTRVELCTWVISDGVGEVHRLIS